jgi:hypothetical protein
MMLLVIGVLASVSAVAADHIEAPSFAEDTSAARFEQYLWALESQELHRPAYALSATDLSMSRLDRFGQYALALEMQEQARQARFANQLMSGPDSGASAWDQYLWATGVTQ